LNKKGLGLRLEWVPKEILTKHILLFAPVQFKSAAMFCACHH